jgi:hypothetical protein
LFNCASWYIDIATEAGRGRRNRNALPSRYAPNSGGLTLIAVGGPMRNRHEDDREADDRRTAALMGLAIVLSLAIAGVVLVRDLGEKAKLEDCLMSGRTNCAPIEVSSPSR